MRIKFLSVLLFLIWLIIVIFAINGGLAMISAANTIENIIGGLLIVITLFVSYKTKCFLEIKNLWREKEE